MPPRRTSFESACQVSKFSDVRPLGSKLNYDECCHLSFRYDTPDEWAKVTLKKSQRPTHTSIHLFNNSLRLMLSSNVTSSNLLRINLELCKKELRRKMKRHHLGLLPTFKTKTRNNTLNLPLNNRVRHTKIKDKRQMKRPMKILSRQRQHLVSLLNSRRNRRLLAS